MEREYCGLFEPSDLKYGEVKTGEEVKRDGGLLTVSDSSIGGSAQFFTVRIKGSVIDDDGIKSALSKEISLILRRLTKKYGISNTEKCFVVGLGNDKVIVDSLGSRVVDRLYVTGHVYEKGFIRRNFGNLIAFKSSVSGLTGIDSFDVIKSLTAVEKPSYIIAVDTLASSSSNNLGKIVQISDNGIEPGGGVGNPKPKLDLSSLGVPVIAIGVPLVIYVTKLITECIVSGKIDVPESLRSLSVAPKEADFLVEEYAEAIARGINLFVHGA